MIALGALSAVLLVSGVAAALARRGRCPAHVADR
jgi:hypothetical protein